MATITGIAGTSINATTTVSNSGQIIGQSESSATVQSICNDLATIATGQHSFAGVKTFLDPVTFSDTVNIGQSVTILAGGTGSQINGTWTAGGAWTHSGTVLCNETVTLTKCPVLGAGYSVNITGATNATPIVITAASHNLVDGQQAVVASVGGNTNANGTWVVNVLSSSTFELVGSVGNSGYTSGGTVTAASEPKFSTARTDTRFLTNLWNDGNQYTGSGWGSADGAFINFITDPTTQEQQFGYEIDLPQGAIIAAGTIYIDPPDGHAAFPGGAPGTFPIVEVFRFTAATGVTSTLASQTDTTIGSAGVYEAYHSITATLGTPEIVDRSRCRYFVVLSTEKGANALAGTRVFAGSVTYSTQFLDQF